MGRAIGSWIIAASMLAAVWSAGARADAPQPLAAALSEHTLNAVAFLPHEAPTGGGSLSRIMFQAYLRQNGSGLVRRWDTTRDAYTVPAEIHWSVEGSTLCLDLPGSGGDGRICVEVHVWGPRIAGNGTGTGRFALLDGDLQPGNALLASR
jgi:hypothetical protein